MKKFLLLTGILLLAFSCFLNAQTEPDPFEWAFVDTFVTTVSQPHGVVVDQAGNIWVQPFARADTFGTAALHVYDPAGTEIALYWHGNIPGIGPDTLYHWSGRGLAEDNNGNILVSCGYLYRINYQDGSFMNRYDFGGGGPTSLTQAACDANGFIYITTVLAGPLNILDTDFNEYNQVTALTDNISRALLVTPDGNDIYQGAITGPTGVLHYHSDDGGPNGSYAVVDTLRGPDHTQVLEAQSLAWEPSSRDYIWVGTYDRAGNPYRGWYAMDPGINNVFQDSLPGPFFGPRGVDFWEESDGSWTAYAADFENSIVTRWTNPGITGIIVVDNGKALISEFELRQNYPNPFNPATSIPFSLSRTADVKLVIYNVKGQVVKTLVNERLQQGSYEYEFDAAGMASGTYFYRLTFDGKTQTKRMMLLK
jgi:sugar lactone lactonase YvrE